jgi:hypothetical protein
MNCWERVLHQLAWFAARGAERVTIYDHDSLVGRHIEVLVPPTTYLGAAASLPVRPIANAASDQAAAGVLGGLQGGLSGAGMGAAAGPYGALAGFILGAGLGAAKGALGVQESSPAAVSPPATAAPPSARAPPSDTPLAERLPKTIPKSRPIAAPVKESARRRRNRKNKKE